MAVLSSTSSSNSPTILREITPLQAPASFDPTPFSVHSPPLSHPDPSLSVTDYEMDDITEVLTSEEQATISWADVPVYITGNSSHEEIQSVISSLGGTEPPPSPDSNPVPVPFSPVPIPFSPVPIPFSPVIVFREDHDIHASPGLPSTTSHVKPISISYPSRICCRRQWALIDPNVPVATTPVTTAPV